MEITITTAIEPSAQLVEQAIALAAELGGKYVPRQKWTTTHLRQQYGDLLIVYRQQLVYLNGHSGQKLFFHVDTALLRSLNGRDPLVEALDMPAGATVIDATMGMATDSVVMAVYGYNVVAVEVNPIIERIVREGLHYGYKRDRLLHQAMQSIQTVCANHLTYLRTQPTNAVDVVYFDPMFTETIVESHNLDGVRALADFGRLTVEVMEEAKRVARHRVLIKAHFRDPIFEQFGFHRIVRKNTKFHFGYLACEEEK